jgi:plasmid stability protein
VFVDDAVEEAERLRDPTHVRCYSEDEWRELLTAAGLEVEQVERFERRPVVDDWLARVETPPADAARVRELLGDRIEDGALKLQSIVVKARKSQR